MASTKETEKKDPASTPINDKQLQEKIRAQVEYYLSRQNLLQDSYLLSKMDKEYFVDVSVIAEFKMVKQLTTDLNVIVESIKDSDQIVLDDSKKRIKPVTFNQRTTLILRNIPTSSPKDAVEKLLASVSLPKILTLRAEIGDNWFATFENEDATKSALELVKGLQWQDKRISAGIKSENVLKGLNVGGNTTFTTATPYIPNGQYAYPYMPDGTPAGYRQGRPGQNFRRGQTGFAGGGPMPEGGENGRRMGGQQSKKKGRGLRERDGTDGSKLPGSSLPVSKEEISLDMADFPQLGGLPSTSSSSRGEEVAANVANKKDEGVKEPPPPPTSAFNGTAEAPPPPPPVQQSSHGKKSYAQMALAAAAPTASATAPPGPKQE